MREKVTLKALFLNIHAIAHRTELREIVEVTVTTDGNGNTVETNCTVIKDHLLILVSRKSAAELEAQYGFSDAQNRRLTELLDPTYADMWKPICRVDPITGFLQLAAL